MTSSPLAFFMKGSFAVPSFILLKAFTIMNTTHATNEEVDDGADERAEIDAVGGACNGDGEARDVGAVAAVMSLMSGLMMSSVSDVTMAVNAAPMMMPTAYRSRCRG